MTAAVARGNAAPPTTRFITLRCQAGKHIICAGSIPSPKHEDFVHMCTCHCHQPPTAPTHLAPITILRPHN